MSTYSSCKTILYHQPESEDYMSPLTISMFTYLSVIPIFSLIFIYDNFQGAVQGIFISLYHHIRSLQYQGFWMLAAGASWFPNISASSLLELIAHLQAWDCSQNLDLFFVFFLYVPQYSGFYLSPPAGISLFLKSGMLALWFSETRMWWYMLNTKLPYCKILQRALESSFNEIKMTSSPHLVDKPVV